MDYRLEMIKNLFHRFDEEFRSHFAGGGVLSSDEIFILDRMSGEIFFLIDLRPELTQFIFQQKRLISIKLHRAFSIIGEIKITPWPPGMKMPAKSSARIAAKGLVSDKRFSASFHAAACSGVGLLRASMDEAPLWALRLRLYILSPPKLGMASQTLPAKKIATKLIHFRNRNFSALIAFE